MGSYEHFIYAPSLKAAEGVAGDLQTAHGYLVPRSPEVSCEKEGCEGCSHHWLVMVYGDADRAFTEGGRDDIYSACDRHGAVYDGGGMFIGNLDQLS